MKSSAASFLFHSAATARLLTFCLLIVAMLAETGCVSQRAYEQARAEADELTRSLNTAREDVRGLGNYIADLEATNRREDAAVTELRAAIQREEETLPILRQRANEKLTLLHTQVANLANQSRLLARQIADAKQESASLKVLVTQYKQEVEEARILPEPALSATSMPPTVPPADAPIPPPVAAPNPVTPPQQMAQVTPVTPAKPPAPSRPVQTPTQAAEESWIDMIMNRFLSLWNWILGLFS
jgi:hypothetical protein